MHPLIPWFDPPAFHSDTVDSVVVPLIRHVAPKFDSLVIHGFGILVALGFLLGSSVGQRKAVKFTGDVGAAEKLNELVTWLIFGTFVGGHFGHVLFYEPEKLAADPGVLLRVWEGLS